MQIKCFLVEQENDDHMVQQTICERLEAKLATCKWGKHLFTIYWFDFLGSGIGYLEPGTSSGGLQEWSVVRGDRQRRAVRMQTGLKRPSEHVLPLFDLPLGFMSFH